MSARTESEIEREARILKSAWESLYGKKFAITLADVQMDDVVFKNTNFGCDGCHHYNGLGCALNPPQWVVRDGKGAWRYPIPMQGCGHWTTTLDITMYLLEFNVKEENSHV